MLPLYILIQSLHGDVVYVYRGILGNQIGKENGTLNGTEYMDDPTWSTNDAKIQPYPSLSDLLHADTKR